MNTEVIDAPRVRPGGIGSKRKASLVTPALFIVSALVATYSGFRVPNRWGVTLQTISLQDGFHRRFLVGTVLQPIAALFGYSYWFYVGVSFAVIAALLAVLFSMVLRTPLASRRALVLAWLLLPTGTFLFNEAGYLDQFLYLALFAALWLRQRSHLIAATVVMTFTPFVHECAILTVLPLFATVVLNAEPIRRAFLHLAAPCVTTISVLLIPAASSDAAARGTRRLAASGWSPSSDVYEVYQRSFAQSWHMFSIREMLGYSAPAAVVMGSVFLLLVALERPGGTVRTDVAYRLLAVAAIGAPALLSFAGWDWNRWMFFAISGFFIIAWMWLGDARLRSVREFGPTQWTVLLVAVMVASHFEYLMFGWATPRPLGWQPFLDFWHGIKDGSVFAVNDD